MSEVKHVSVKPDHVCSIYCSAEIHASVLYSHREFDSEEMRCQWLGDKVYMLEDPYRCRGVIVDIRRAPEADGTATGRVVDRHYAYLVFVNEGVKSEV